MIAALALAAFIIMPGCDNGSSGTSNASDKDTAAAAEDPPSKPKTDKKQDESAKPKPTKESAPPADATDEKPATERPAEKEKAPAKKEAPAKTEPLASGPRFQPLDSSVYRFGTVWTDSNFSHDFHFKNVGDAPLKVLSWKAHCSCSTAGDYTKVVQPGETGVFPYNLSTKNAEGDLSRNLNVFFNDPNMPEWKLYMTGYVKDICSIEVVTDGRVGSDDPAGLQKISGLKANFEEITKNETLFRVLKLVNTSEHSPLELKMMPVAGGRFEATLNETKPGEEWELTIVGSPPWRTGYNNGLIRFRTNVPEKPTWAVPIYARLPERIEVVPSKIIANMKRATAKTRPIRIKNHGDTPIKVTSVACTSPDYRVTLLPRDPAKPNESVVEVILPAGDYEPPKYGEVVRIETTDAEKSQIDIMVLPSFAPATPRPADKPMKFYPGKMLD